jgi:hypothetical protein
MRKFLLLMGTGLLFALPLCAGDLEGGNPLPAVWKEQRLNFVYMGATSRYSCEGLRGKMRTLLLALGARPDLKISAFGCDYGRPNVGAVGVPSLWIIFSAPALPDGGAKPLHPGDLTATSARFQPFTVSPDAFRTFEIGDCELVEEFGQQILPKFVTRDVTKRITCVPNQLSLTPFVVRGEVLKAMAPASSR